MIIIGIKGSGRGTAAALIVGGKLTAVAEERLNCTSRSSAFPVRAVKHLLEAAGVEGIGAVDLVVASDLERGHGEPIEDRIRTSLAYSGKIHLLGNHDAHAAAAFFASPFDDAAVLVADGAGDLCRQLSDGQPHYRRADDGMVELQATYRGCGERLTRIDLTSSDPSHRLGIVDVQRAVAAFLNFDPDDLGSVDDLAAWGGRKPLGYSPFLTDFDGDIVCKGGRNFVAEPQQFARAFLGGLKPRTDQVLPDQIYTEIAHKAQKEVTDAMGAMAQRLRRITRARNLCVAGRIVFNAGTMGSLAENAGFENLFIFPTGDGVSVAAGCALWGAKVLKQSKEHFEISGATLGPVYPDERIAAAIEAEPDLKPIRPEKVAEKAAELLAAGRTVAWFQGGSEAGPRGAGRRSLLAGAGDSRNAERLAKALGRTESYRRFGLSILEEFARAYFESDGLSPAMTLAARARKGREENLSLRADGTARVQTVSRRTDLLFYDLLDRYYRHTGVPLLLNAPLRTEHGVMAETPDDAVMAFRKTGADALIAGPYLVQATGAPTAEKEDVRPIERQKGMTAKIKDALGFR